MTELSRSQTVRCYEPAIIPGLMQTADYARCVFTKNADFRESPRDTEDAVRARLKRQEALYDRDRRSHFLVWEAALHVLLSPRQVMASQLDRLGGLIGLDTVSVGIIPLHTPMRRSPGHGFMIYDERLVTVETLNAEMWLDDSADIQPYFRAWEWLNETAVFGRQARRLIALAQAALEALTMGVRCSYCQEPAGGLRCRLIREDRNSPVVALGHAGCYPVFLDDLVLVAGGVEGAHPRAGSCHLCGTYVQRARVIAEIHGDSAAGATVVRCLACCLKKPPRPATPAGVSVGSGRLGRR